MGTLKWHSIRTKLNRCKLAFMRTAGGFIWSCAKAVIGCGPSASPTSTANGRKWSSPGSATATAQAGDVLTLSSARNKAREYKVALKRDGVDPRVKKRATTQRCKTFKEFAEEQYPGWCKGLSEEEEKQWARSIRDVPSLHDLKVHEITTEHVLEALKPIWSVKPVTASRTRQRIERLMDAAKALKLSHGREPGRVARQPQTPAAVAPEAASQEGAQIRALHEDAADDDRPAV